MCRKTHKLGFPLSITPRVVIYPSYHFSLVYFSHIAWVIYHKFAREWNELNGPLCGTQTSILPRLAQRTSEFPRPQLLYAPTYMARGLLGLLHLSNHVQLDTWSQSKFWFTFLLNRCTWRALWGSTINMTIVLVGELFPIYANLFSPSWGHLYTLTPFLTTTA